MNRKLLFPAVMLLASLLACSTGGTVAPPASITPTPNAPPLVVTDTPIPPPALPVVASPVLLRIDFQNTANGWGLADGAIVRTVDGGTTWLNATPPGLSGIGYSNDLFVLDDDHVWVQAPGSDFYTGTLYRTSDGGLNWTSFPVPFGSADVQFLDTSTGRVLADRGAGAGSNAVEVFQSGDGGATWTSVFHDDPSVPGASDTLPLGGIKNGMTFLDGNTGWVTGNTPVDGFVYLYVTHDGGATWAAQSILLPAEYVTSQFLAQPPIFFGPNDGLLPINIYWSSSLTLQTFYVTHDGGSTWTGNPSDGNQVLDRIGAYSFVDVTHGWAWDGGSSFRSSYALTPGVPGWAGTAATLDLTDVLSQLESVPGPGGQFTLWALTSVDELGHARLFKTTDNGTTWLALIP